METRANYIIVGIVTIAVLLASFGFVYWIARGGDSQNMVPLEVRIPGSVTGLTVGSQVLFNGIKVGDVRRMQIDPENPDVVIIGTQVDRSTPVTPKTVATLGFQGLTGQAYIELKGGDLKERNLLQAAEETGETARIEADPGAVNNLIDKAQQIATRADKVLISLEQFVDDNQQPLTQSIANVRGFTEALSKNSQNIDEFLVNVGELSTTLKGVSGRLDTTLASAEELLRGVDRKKIDSVLANADKISADLAKSSGEIEKLVAGVQDGVKKFGEFSTTASKTIESVDRLVSAADAVKIKTTIDNVEAASKTARTALDDVSEFTAKFRGKDGDIEKIVSNVKEFTDRLDQTSVRLDGVLANADKISADLAKSSGKVESLVAGVQDGVKKFGEFSTTASKTMENVDRLVSAADAAKIKTTIDNVEAASKTARTAMDDVSNFTGKFREKDGDIEQIVGNVKELTGRLNQTSVRIDGVLAKVDGLLGEDGGAGEGLVADARATLASFRKVADTLNSRLGEITDGLAKFSGRGLSDIQGAVQDSRRSISRIESAITNLERNPERLIFGGTDSVPRSDGRNRR